MRALGPKAYRAIRFGAEGRGVRRRPKQDGLTAFMTRPQRVGAMESRRPVSRAPTMTDVGTGVSESGGLAQRVPPTDDLPALPTALTIAVRTGVDRPGS